MVSADLKHGNHSSLAPNLPKLWVIEMLAGSSQVDVSLLLDLVKETPEIVDDICKNARELVSLRILESFCDQRARANSVSFAPISKIGINPSERCDDVLQRILQEASTSDLKNAGLEMLKWDFQPFIAHKRSSLAKCSLKELKDAILTGSHPLFASLKEQSGLLVGNQSVDKVPVDESNCSDITPRLEGGDTNTQIGGVNDQLISPTLANGSNPSYKNMSDNNSLLSKRKRSAYSESNGDMQLTDAFLEVVQQSEGERCTLGKKSHILGIAKSGSSGYDNNGHTSLERLASPNKVLPCEKQLHDCVLDDTSGIVCRHLYPRPNTLPIIVENSVDSGEKIHVEGIEMNGPSRTGNNKQTSPKKVTGVDEVSPCEKQDRPCDTNMPNEAYDEEEEQDRDLDFTEGDTEVGSGLKTSNKGMETEPDIQRNVCETEDVNIVCRNDVYHGDMANVARWKNVFTHSQFTCSEDSSEKVDWRKLNRCMKCNNSGHLLVCSSDSCSSAIHEKCLGSNAIYDRMEEFYCPFCAYSLALSKYLEAKTKVSSARKELATFLCGRGITQSKERSYGSHGRVQSHLEPDDDSHKSEKRTRYFGEEIDKIQSRKKSECKEAGPSVSSSGDNPPRQVVESISESTRNLCKGKKGEGREQESQLLRVHGQNQMPAGGNHITQNESTEFRSKNEVLCSPRTDFLSDSTYSPVNESISVDEISEEDSENSGSSKYFISVRKHDRQRSNPETPQLRRKRVPWTVEEEQRLKEGIQRFYVADDKNIPWKKILEYGENVFHESRTTADLKDKFKNVKKLLAKFYPSDETAQVP